MKYLPLLLLIVAVTACVGLPGCGAAPAQVSVQLEQEKEPITFIRDHAAGVEVARQEGKPTLIFFSVPGNIGSQLMIETTFCDEEIKRLAERFVCILVDASQELKLCESLNIVSFPTILLVNTESSEVRRLVGKQTSDQLAVQMHVVLQTRALRSVTAR